VSKDRRFVLPSETTTAPSDVLSESTDLNTLLTALLGQGSTAPPPRSSDVEVVGDLVQASGDDPSAIAAKAPPVPSLSPPRHEVRSLAAATDWISRFPSERSDPAVDAPRDFGVSHGTLVTGQDAAAHAMPVVAAIVQPLRTVVQKRRGFLSRDWLAVAIGSVVMLVTLSAISTRSGNDATPAAPDITGALKTPSSSSQLVSPAATTPLPSRPLSSATAQVPPIPRAAAQAATTVKRPMARTGRAVRTLGPQRPAASRNDPQNAASMTTATESEFQSARSAAEGSTTASPIDVAPVEEQSSSGEARLPHPTTPAAITPEATGAAASQIQLHAPSAPEVSASAKTAAAPRRTAPRRLSGGVPEYLNALRAARVGGTVQVRVTIDATGRVTKAESVSGPGPLREAAERAVRQWQYHPATLNGAPIDSEITLSFTFNPNKASRP
jgi:periplasmic protein TonB